jgi:hypothetical protein
MEIFDLTALSERLTNDKSLIIEQCREEIKIYESANQRKCINLARIVLWWDKYSTELINLSASTSQTVSEEKINIQKNSEKLIREFYGYSLNLKTIKNHAKVITQLFKRLKDKPEIYLDDDGAALASFCRGKFEALIFEYDEIYSPKKEEEYFVENAVIETEYNLSNYEKSSNETFQISAGLDNISDISQELDKKSISTIENYLESRKKKTDFIPYSNHVLDPYKYSIFQREKILAETAKSFFKYCSQIPTESSPISFKSNNDGYAIGIFKTGSVDNHHKILGSSIDNQIISLCLVEAYRDRYEALPTSVRNIFEILLTQLPSRGMIDIEESILPESLPNEFSNQQYNSKRRLTFKNKTKSFLLSHCNSLHGIVTSCTPKQEFLQKFQSDVYMSIENRMMIEQRILIPRDIHIFKPDNDEIFPLVRPKKYGIDPISGILTHASHSLRLDNTLIPGDDIYIQFWPFYATPSALVRATKSYSIDQADHKPLGKLNIKNTFSLSARDLRNFSNGFTADWLLGKSAYLRRENDQYKYFRFHISSTHFTLENEYENGSFLGKFSIELKNQFANIPKENGVYLSHQLAVALQTFGLIEVIGDVKCHTNEKIFILEFETSAGKYRIDIPKCDDNLNPYTDIFELYSPEFYFTGHEEQLPAYEPTIDQFRQNRPDGIIPDYVIEQFIRSGSTDDYDDLLETDSIIMSSDYEE